MKMEWKDGQLNKGAVLLFHGVPVAEVWPSVKTEGVWCRILKGHPPVDGYETLEAAKAAAEQAVLKWFREALGEPVAWRVEWEEHHPYGSTTAAETFVDFYYTLDDVPENLRRNATALYARPEASDE